MINKTLVILLTFGILLAPLITSEDYTLNIDTTKDTLDQGETLSIKVTVRDSEGKLVNDNVAITIQDAEKKFREETTIISNTFQEIEIGEDASYGQGKIIAKYKEAEAQKTFTINIQEKAEFKIEKDTLTITNTGNTQYTKTVQITIGETTGIKQPKIAPGKSISYKLVAPEGTYNIKVTDGKTTITQGEVQLTGTGQVVGALDRTSTTRSPVTGTGGAVPSEGSDEALLSYIKNSKFVYTFVLVVFGAMILLAIERKYSKKASA